MRRLLRNHKRSGKQCGGDEGQGSLAVSMCKANKEKVLDRYNQKPLKYFEQQIPY